MPFIKFIILILGLVGTILGAIFLGRRPSPPDTVSLDALKKKLEEDAEKAKKELENATDQQVHDSLSKPAQDKIDIVKQDTVTKIVDEIKAKQVPVESVEDIKKDAVNSIMDEIKKRKKK